MVPPAALADDHASNVVPLFEIVLGFAVIEQVGGLHSPALCGSEGQDAGMIARPLGELSANCTSLDANCAGVCMVKRKSATKTIPIIIASKLFCLPPFR